MILPIGNEPLTPLPPVSLPLTSKENLSLLGVLPFAQLSSEEIEFSAKIAQTDEKLLNDLDNLLFRREGHIESHLKEIESSQKDQKIVRALLNVQEWASDYASEANEAVKDGVEFLDGLVPKVLLNVGDKLDHFLEHLNEITSIGGNFLTALNSGALGVALVCKGKILRETSAALSDLKRTYTERKKELSEARERTGGGVSQLELKQMKNGIKELQKTLRKELKEYRQEQSKFAKKTAHSSLLSVSHLMAALEGAFTYAQLTNHILYTTSSALGLIFSFYEMQSELRSSKKFHHWVDLLDKWKGRNERTLTIDADRKITLNPLPGEENALKAIDTTIQTSQDLLAKRRAVDDKKISHLRPQLDQVMPKIMDLKQKEFLNHLAAAIKLNLNIESTRKELQSLSPPIMMGDKLLQSLVDEVRNGKTVRESLTATPLLKEHFKVWFDAQSPQLESDAVIAKAKEESLLRFYVDHQATLEQTTKNALVQMIQKKQVLDSALIKHKLVESITLFTGWTAIIAASAALWVLGLMTTPFGGAGFIIMSLSLPIFLVTVSFYIVQLVRNRKRYPELNKEYRKGTGIDLLYSGLRSAIAEYRHSSKQKNLLVTATIVHNLHMKSDLQKEDPEYLKAFEAYKTAKKAFQVSQVKVAEWSTRLNKLQERMTAATWKDFSTHADLSIGQSKDQFDTLHAFNEALNQCDLSLMSPETKELLEDHLGLDLKVMQEKMEKDPVAIRNSLQKFFILSEADYIKFINIQNKRPKLIKVS